MNALMQCAREEGVQVSITNNAAYVKVSRISSEGEYMSMLDQLMKLHSEHNPAAWTFDLSEVDGFPLGLASVLLGFAHQAGNEGSEVRVTGIRGNLLPVLLDNKERVRHFGVSMTLDDNDCQVTLQSF